MTLMSPEQAGARHALLYFTFRNRISRDRHHDLPGQR
jgi:hypothetical protein